jgi:diguanylate cyclase (GGDEF)-like protein/PAS domain S-box-containing protein
MMLSTLAAVLIPPALDAAQALRLRRLGLAALGYVVAIALVALAAAFGTLAAGIALEVAAAYLALNLGLYALIRSGYNLRLADPSLTLFQILASITVLMYLVYHLDAGRDVALFACFAVFLFGMFRLDTRGFMLAALYTLAAYALVIYLLLHWRSQAIGDIALEWMSWLALAGLLLCFAIVGGQINGLRRKLRDSEQRFRSLTEMSSDFHWESDAAHRLTQRASADRKLSRVSVFLHGTQIGQRRWEIPYLSPDEAGWRAHRAVLDAHLPFRDFELSRLGLDGSERHIAISGDPVFDAAGAFQGYRGVGTDVSARKRAERALRETSEKLRLFADSVPAMAVYWDEGLRLRFANRVFTGFFGFALDDILGKHVSEVLGKETYREVERHFERVLQGHSAVYQRMHRFANGELRHIEVKLLPQIGEQGKVLGCFAVTTDITEHKLTEERIRHIAHHDSLTGLPNRLLFNDRLDQAISLAKRDSHRFALLYLDLDKFKPVNDALGHAAGDELLQSVAARMRRELRESDTIARIGGDEFAVILPLIGRREEAQTVAVKLTAALAAPFRLGDQGNSATISSSIGIALYPADGADADALVRAADAAMYRAKQAGSSPPARAA